MSGKPWKPVGQHRREHSFASMMKDREEDLALFQNMRARDNNYFNDDIEASLTTKFGGVSGYQSVVPSTPAKKIANDLLTSESGKHDYDWLLTPPGTPLFPSLDHERPNATRFHHNLPTILGSANKTSRVASDLSHTSSKVVRSIASPRQPSSPSSRSIMNGIPAVRSSFSAMSSASPGSRPSTPSRRPSTPTPTRPSTPTVRPSSPMKKPSTPTARPSTPGRPSTPTTRSTTPTARPLTPASRPSIPATRSSSYTSTSARSPTPTSRTCMPTGSSSTQLARPTTPTLRCSQTASVGPSIKAKASPGLTNGNPCLRPSSPSKKLQMFNPVMPGQLSDPPPNLRTSIPQRSTSASRGSSLNSRPGGNGITHRSDVKDVFSRSGRRALSPSPSISYSSSNHDHDNCSSHSSKDSVISPFPTRVHAARTSLTRFPAPSESVTDRPGRMNEDVPAGRTSISSKKPVRPYAAKETSLFGGSISKKSIDTAVRHMDVRRSTPSGFRPLMSNGPVSTFYTRTSSLLRRPGSPSLKTSTSSANVCETSPENNGFQEKVRDCKAAEKSTCPDRMSFTTQVPVCDEENGNQCSEPLKANEGDAKPGLHSSVQPLGNCPEICLKEASDVQVLEAVEEKETGGHDLRQDYSVSIEHSVATKMLVDTQKADSLPCCIQTVTLDGNQGDMLQFYNGHTTSSVNHPDKDLLNPRDGSFSGLKDLAISGCNKSFKVDELSNYNERQIQTANLALELEARLRQDLALEVEMLSFCDQSGM